MRNGWILLLALLTGCGSDDEVCETRSDSPQLPTAATCAADGAGARVTLTASPCYGKPDSCTFTTNGTDLQLSLKTRVCSSGETQSTGCAAPSTFDCTGPTLPAGTYAIDTMSIQVAGDGTCSVVP